MRTRTLTLVLGLALLALLPAVASPQSVLLYDRPVSLAGSASVAATSTPCVLVKYVGSTVGKPTVEVAAGGDLTFKIATVADATTGSPNLDGIFDLSTPAAAVDTYGEFVQLVNSTGSNWRAVLVGCLAADLTNNTLDTLSATDAAAPGGVALYKEATIASATSVFSAQVALLPDDAATNIRFFLSGSPVGAPSGSSKVNPNPFDKFQTYVQSIREKITSTGVIALFEVLAVKRVYSGGSSGGNTVTETVRSLYSETGAATTVEKAVNFHTGPIVTAPGELVIVRQRTATDLTALQIAGNGFAVRVP